jgi:hypothetical protein
MKESARLYAWSFALAIAGSERHVGKFQQA